VVAYFNFKAYGTPTPTGKENTSGVQASSLLQMKTAISYYMPNKHMSWDDVTGTGNPTRSIEVNEMIKIAGKKKFLKTVKNTRKNKPNNTRKSIWERNKHSESLELLWEEYTQGIDGGKPAKDLTRRERGQIRFKYSRRKVVWDLIAAHVRAGRPAADVIDQMYAAYGRSASATQVINRLREDKKHGKLPAPLQI